MRGSAGTPGGRRPVAVNGYSERWLRQGFPWVYPAECTGARPPVGQIVSIVGADGSPLGVGVADDGWIAVRRFRADDGPVDAALLALRVDEAWALRRDAVPADTTAWRLIQAENDELPGVRVDAWGVAPTGRGGHLVITLDSPSLRGLVPALVELLEERFAPETIHLAWRPDPREASPTWPAEGLQPGLLRGEPLTEPIVVTERGVRFWVDPAGTTGQGPVEDASTRRDAGLYADMRSNRAWLDDGWAGTELLNLFAYTGAFSVFAALRGATTTSVDLSAPYLGRARANFELNGLDPEAHAFLEEDGFKALDRLRRQGRTFDRVVLDPPGFSHGPSGRWSAEQDYGRLVAAALRVLRPGGWLVAACNVGSMSPRTFDGALTDGARKAGRRLQVIHTGSQAPDFPAAAHFPEGRYLKLVVAVAR